METFVTELLKNADLSVVTKKSVRHTYKEHLGRDLSHEEKADINKLVYQFVDKYAEEQKKESSSSSPDKDSPGNKENYQTKKKSSSKIILKGQVVDKQVAKKTVRKPHTSTTVAIAREKSKQPPNEPLKKYPMRARKVSPKLDISEVMTAVLDSDKASSEPSDSDADNSISADSETEHDHHLKMALERLREAREKKIQMSQQKKQKFATKSTGKSKVVRRLSNENNRVSELKNDMISIESSDSIVLISESDHSEIMSNTENKKDKLKDKELKLGFDEILEPEKEVDSSSSTLAVKKTPEKYDKIKKSLKMKTDSGKMHKTKDKQAKRKVISSDSDDDFKSERPSVKRRKIKMTQKIKKKAKSERDVFSISDTESDVKERRERMTTSSDRKPLREVAEYKTKTAENIDSDSSTGDTPLIKKKGKTSKDLHCDSDSSSGNTPLAVKKRKLSCDVDSDAISGDTPLIKKKGKTKITDLDSESDMSTGDTPLAKKKGKTKLVVSDHDSDDSTGDTPLAKKKSKSKITNLDSESDISTGDTPLIKKKGKTKNDGHNSDVSTGDTPLARKRKKSVIVQSDSEMSTGDTPLIKKKTKTKSEKSDINTSNTLSEKKQLKAKVTYYDSDESTGDTPLIKKKNKTDKSLKSDSTKKSDKTKNKKSIPISIETAESSESSSEDTPKKLTIDCDSGSEANDNTPVKRSSKKSSTIKRRRLDISMEEDQLQETVDHSESCDSESEAATPVKAVNGSATSAVKDVDNVSNVAGVSNGDNDKVKDKTSADRKEMESSESSSSDDDEPLSTTKTKIAQKQTKLTNTQKSSTDSESPHLKNLRKICRACGMFIRNDRELKGCSTDKQKISRLKDLLQNLGMKGQPSIKKAEEVRLKKEAAELNSQNIISTEPSRGKRKVISKYSRRVITPKKTPIIPSENPFGSLKGIVDSEGSDSD